MKKHLLIFFYCLVSLSVSGQRSMDLGEIVVTRPGSGAVKLGLPEDRPFVVFVLGADCPISQKYIPAIKALHEQFGGRVDFVGIFPAYFTVAEVTAFINDYGLTIPCYIDQDMKAIDWLQATVTPEAFLFSPGRERRYAGAIDNWFYDLGRYRQEATDYYLKDAIASVLNGAVLKATATEAIGCLIQRNSPSPEHSHQH